MTEKERLQAMAQAFKDLAAQKEISAEEMQGYIVEVLERVFSKTKNLHT
jgi:hypothetical protein